MPRQLEFVKMHGAGNDYVHVDATRQPIDEADGPELARRLSDRHFGVGSDGLILLLPAEPDSAAACRMAMWNADGSRGAVCGNGLRCLALHAREVGVVDHDRFLVATDTGDRAVELLRGDGPDAPILGARLDLGEVRAWPLQTRSLQFDDRAIEWVPGDAGNPHAVVFLDQSPDSFDVAHVGTRMQGEVPGGVNVEFVQVVANATGRLVQRTWERGSGETLACGTGAAVAALAALESGRCTTNEVSVQLLGGTLRITFGDAGPNGRTATLEGPARIVFRGVIEI